ncbi:D-glycero-alpha-D-manno-heptose-7-phosphate kinase [Gammaproteobacteria bacterium]
MNAKEPILMSHAISRTPFRVSFFGGGSDYPAWYLKYGGAVLSTTINRYCYISCRYLPQFFGIRHRIVWSHIETVNSISEILHPAVRAGLQAWGFDDYKGIELLHQGDLPARSGIGSSSSFAVGLANALYALRGIFLDKHALALAAIELEQNQLRDNVGSQDQVAAAYGGFNLIKFKTDGRIEIEPVPLSQERLALFQGKFMMFYTGTTRLSSMVAKKLIENLDNRVQHIETIHRMVYEASQIVQHGDLDDFGRMLHETWCLKRELVDNISSGAIDEIYGTAVAAGALGGKLLGAGGAGFMVFYVPEERQEKVRNALHNLLYVPVQFDFTGSTLIYRVEE